MKGRGGVLAKMNVPWGQSYSKTNKDKQGGRGVQNSGILSEHTFWMSPKDENGEYVPHLEITEVILEHCNVVNNNYH